MITGFIQWIDYEIIDQPYNKLQYLKTYMRSLGDYQEQISTIKINHPQVVDDITLDFLEVEMIISEEPSIALSKLNSIRSKLETRTKNSRDWEQFNYLLDLCYDALGLENAVDTINN